MRIVEQFDTLQGEGKYLGVPSHFIRTTGCNLRCAWENPDKSITYCDTPYTSWKPEKGNVFNMQSTLEHLGKSRIKHVVITGGEPTMQKDIGEVVNGFIDNGYHVTVETNGTIYVPGIQRAFMSISPKLMNSYAQEEGSLEFKIHGQNNNYTVPTARYVLENDHQLKYVVNEPNDVNEVRSSINDVGGATGNTYLMPQGITSEQLSAKTKWIFKNCVHYGFNYSPRMHIDIFGNKRGI